jgi:hypothetical protein
MKIMHKASLLILYIFGRQSVIEPATVAVRSDAWVLSGWLLGSWVRIPLKAWMFVRVLCCVVLCRQRPCDGQITRPRSPTICLNSSRNLLYARRPRSFKDCRARGVGCNKIIVRGVYISFIRRCTVEIWVATAYTTDRQNFLGLLHVALHDMTQSTFRYFLSKPFLTFTP